MAKKPGKSTYTCPPKGSGKFDDRMSHHLRETTPKGKGMAPAAKKKSSY